jgi:hypothetical protein
VEAWSLQQKGNWLKSGRISIYLCYIKKKNSYQSFHEVFWTGPSPVSNLSLNLWPSRVFQTKVSIWWRCKSRSLRRNVWNNEMINSLTNGRDRWYIMWNGWCLNGINTSTEMEKTLAKMETIKQTLIRDRTQVYWRRL